MCALCEELDKIFTDTGGMDSATHAEDLIISRFLSAGMPQDMDNKTRAALRRDFPEGLDTDGEIFHHLMTMDLPPGDDDLVKIARLSVPEGAEHGMYQGFNPFGDAGAEPMILGEFTGNSAGEIFGKLRDALGIPEIMPVVTVLDSADIVHLITALSMHTAMAETLIDRDGPSEFWQAMRDRSQEVMTKLAGVTSLVAPPF